MYVRAFFEALAPRYDRELAFSGAEIRRRLQPLLAGLKGASRVLDLGVGTGRELPLLFDAGHRVVGVDLSPRMIAECKKRARAPELVEADFYAPLPFAAASFDAVVALHGTLAHPPHDDAHAALFAELARVLRPGGQLYFEVPDPRYLRLAATLHPGGGEEDTAEGRFLVQDAQSGLSLAGVAWPESRWRQLLTPCFAAIHVGRPSDYELAITAERT